MFSSDVSQKISNYVYRLCDPRNAETFYVGRGKGNRVFEHAKAALSVTGADSEDVLSLKLVRIRRILDDEMEPLIVIHRHGMDEATAGEVEAALIESYPGLTNVQGGTGTADRGSMCPKQLVETYELPELEIINGHRLLFIKVNQTTVDDYGGKSAVRLAWKLNLARASRADYILRVTNGIVRAVHKPVNWREATAANFPDHPDRAVPGRRGFDIAEDDAATLEARSAYLNHRLPAKLQGGQGAAFPARYSYE